MNQSGPATFDHNSARRWEKFNEYGNGNQSIHRQGEKSINNLS